MDQNQENQKQPGQDQGGPAEVGVMQQESPRKCNICGGPNHHGCGCEARQRREDEEDSAMNHERGEPGPEPQPALDWFHQKLTEEEREMALRVRDNFENISVILQDIVSLLKTISSDIKKLPQSKPGPAKRTVHLKSKKRR